MSCCTRLVWAAGDRAGSGGNAIALGALAVHKKISNQVRRQSGPIREPIMSRIARTSRYSRRTVLAGAAKVRFAEEPEPQLLRPGDWLDIAPHRRHRVDWTDPETPTVWLAVFYS